MKLIGLPNTPATYYILNKTNHRIYVGQTVTLHKRGLAHLATLTSNTHANHGLQADWNTYGRDAFEFGILVPGTRARGSDQESFEDIFVRVYQSDDPRYGYNIGHFGKQSPSITKSAKVECIARVWNLEGRRITKEIIRRCIDYTYADMFGEQP
jgi:group I intron endonuclease